jgi:hypothetical protein
LFGGFYTVRFQLGDAVGRSVMYARGGKMLGGNSAFAHIGTYQDLGDEIVVEIKTVRHNPDPNFPAMAGTDDATLLARGKPDGELSLRRPAEGSAGPLVSIRHDPGRGAVNSDRRRRGRGAASSMGSIPSTCAFSTVSLAA